MKTWTTKSAIEGLRYVLGLVVLWESCVLLFASMGTVHALHGSGHVGPHVWIRLLVASVEIVAAVMFLAPVVNVAGSYLLLAVFEFAVLFHMLHGQFESGGLFVYAMAVLVWLAHRKEERARPRDVQ